MTNFQAKDAGGSTIYLKSSGAGSNGDPFIPEHTVSGAVAVTDNSGSLTVDDGGSSLTVDGTVSLGAGTAAFGKLAANDGVDIGDVTVNNASGASAVNIQDGGNSITIDGTVTANIGTSGSLALDATLTGGTQKAITRGGAKGSTTAADVTSTASGSNHQPLDVAIYDASGSQITSFGGGTQYTEGDTDSTITGTAALWEDTSNTLSTISAAKPLPVNIVAGGASGGTAQGDRSSFTDGSGSLTPIGAVFNDTPTDPTEDQIAAPRITAKRALHANLRNVAGTEIATSSNPVRTDPTGTTAQPVTDNGGSLTVDNGGTFAVQESGAALTSLQLIDDALVADNAGFTDGTTKLDMGGYIFDEVAGTALTENDAAAARVDSKRAQVMVVEDATTRGQRQVVTAAGAASVNLAQLAGSTVSTAATGVQKVGVVGNGGATVDSVVGAGTAPTNQVVVGQIYNTTAPAPTNGQAMALQSDQAGNQLFAPGMATATLSAWNSGTSLNATQTIFSHSGVPAVLVQLAQTTTLSAGAVTFEVTFDGSNWSTISSDAVIDPTSATQAVISLPYTVQASTNKAFLLLMKGAQGLRAKLSTQITGSGTVTPNYALLAYPGIQQAILGAGSATIGSLAANQSVNVAQLAGTTTDTNSGNKSAGTLRVVLATDQPALTNKLLVTPDANSAVNVAQINGVTALMGNGVTGTGSQRVTIASDNTAFSVNATSTGNVAHDAADSGNPVKQGFKAINAEVTAVSNADRADGVADLTGKQIVLPYANPENFTAGVTSDITGTSNTSVIAAQGSGVRTYITQITVTNSHATVGTWVNIKDGTTTIYTGYAAAAGGGFTITLPVPLRCTANTAVNAANETTGSNTRVSISGYKGV